MGEGDFGAAHKIEEESTVATEKDIKNYSQLYLEFNSFGGTLRLNARWCVILPFFKTHSRVPPKKEGDPKRDEATLQKVASELQDRFYFDKEKVSYQYRECDWRWRHVGERKGEIVLFDLADLVEKRGCELRRAQRIREETH